MSSLKPTIKPTNHTIHPCPNDKKLALLKELISQNNSEDIIVVASVDAIGIADSLKELSVKVLDDKTLIKDKELTCSLLISYDLPLKAVIYMARLSHTTLKAIMLVNETEQKLLYPIETLLGRVIKQESVAGFEYDVKEKPAIDPKAPKKLSKEKIKEIAKKNYDEKVDTPKPKREYKKDAKRDDEKAKQWEKKKKAPNKFLGKDENGKAIFSGKSGERNHRYDGTPRDRYDAPKKVGRKINIKALKPKKD
ncbi:MAG: hypothetical protein U9N33_10295 [Campylobacterota bacterium]|nr:hypothetical protein [Campylobacterota bacterium]